MRLMVASWLGALFMVVAPASESDARATTAIVIATSRGVETVAVSRARGYPTVPAPRLVALLPVSATVDHDWAEIRFAEQPFRFLLEAPAFVYQNQVTPLVGGAYVERDTLYVPLQWLAVHIPRIFREGFRYDPMARRFEEANLTPVVSRVSAPGRTPEARGPDKVPEAAKRAGLSRRHKVVVDAGHGGRDPGTRGRYLPRGVQEKHVVLSIAKLVRDILTDRGVAVVMTRTRDVLVPWKERAPICGADCELFVSIHVNSLENRGRNHLVRGVETYFLPQDLTADPGQVAAMENEAIRFETDLDEVDDGLGFIMRDLARNEYLRESALLAELVHDRLARVHPGGSRRMAQDNFAVLRLATRPAILVETGYGSNRQDARYINSRAGQLEIAAAMADGIVEYLRRLEAKTTALPQ